MPMMFRVQDQSALITFSGINYIYVQEYLVNS